MTQKINKIDITLNQNSNDLDKIKKISIEINTENFSKNFIEIPILVNQPVFSIDGPTPII